MSYPLPSNRSPLRLKTEASREREALRYLHAWVELYKPLYIRRNAFPTDHPMPAPAACNDTALAAFAQLAALRMGARRAFITIMTTHNEHVLVESTRTMSLQSDFVADPQDESWLGTGSFARSDGINDLSLDGWRKARSPREIPEDNSYYYIESCSPHWHIVSDIRNNAALAQREFVRRATSPRFFFSLPLRDQEGTVIGSLTVLDDKPRYGVNTQEMSYCEDLCDTITQHLQSAIFRSQRERSERLIQALGIFNNGGTSLREWWVGQDNSSMARGDRHEKIKQGRKEQDSRFDAEFGAEQDRSSQDTASQQRKLWKSHRDHAKARSAGEDNEKAARNRMENGVIGEDFSSHADNPPDSNDESTGSDNPPLSPSETPALNAKESEKAQKPEQDSPVNKAYSRASRLLRESMGASGVAFVDAGAIFSTPSGTKATSSGSSDDGKPISTSDTDVSERSAAPSRKCKVSAISTQAQKAEEGSHPVRFELLEQDMTKLIKSYPRGKVFSFMKDGSAYSGSSDSKGGSGDTAMASGASRPHVKSKHSRNACLLRKAVGNAGSIAFYPIWDDDRERWRSVLLIWTTSSTRFFHPDEDLTYMSAFAHSLRAELSRIETAASDVAKGKFITSVSHELRSPLHGILAGIEMLQDSPLSAFQEEMVVSVALAGRTLLDTVDHILDYSKISNLSREQKKDRARLGALRHKMIDASDNSGMTNVDLASLTEEVVESTISGYRHLQRASDCQDQHDEHAVSVTLDIEKRANWTTPMMPGTMTRLITNILGNALKFTTKGLISVKLYTDESNGISSGERPEIYCNLQIKDTGIGMSQEFLDANLFTAFKQADSHSTGTGLGMSIVKEVAKDLNASVIVRSDLGKGTIVTVRFLSGFAHSDDDDPGSAPSTPATPGFPRHFRMLDMKNDVPYSHVPGAQQVVESVLRTASSWLGCDTSSSPDSSTCPPGALCAMSEKDMLLLDEQDPGAVERMISMLAKTCSQILVLSQSVFSVDPGFDFEGFALKPLYIYQPIGPQKLMRVISSAQDSLLTRRQSDFAMPTPRRPRMIRGRSSTTPKEAKAAPYFQIPTRQTTQAEEPQTPTTVAGASDTETPERSPTSKSTTTDSPTLSNQAVFPAARQRQHGQLVLLVEDNDINMRLLQALMKKLKLPCESAINGLEALEKYQAAPMQYFLVLMDMNMPVMDGFEATQKIRALEHKENMRKVHIAAITGVTNADAKKSAKQAGVDKYVIKPVRMRDLTTLIDEIQEGE